jgi:diphosphomevalonate decarboxylase
MQALVKYHGLKNWELRIPYHDSVSVNTSSLFTRVNLSEGRHGIRLVVNGRKNESARRRVEAVIQRLGVGDSAKPALLIESQNSPRVEAKGLGFSSSAGASLTLALYYAIVAKKPNLEELSKVARLFAASASRALVGGFSRLHVGRGDDDTFAERIGDGRTMDLRMIIVPFASTVRTEDAHKEVESSPFFRARIGSAQKRCDLMEKAIRQSDLRKLGELAERDSLELHAVTMTGKKQLLIMTEGTLRVISKVRELRSEGKEAYFSMQTGPSVFINTSSKDGDIVKTAISKLGYRTFDSGVGPEAQLVS